MFLQLLAVAALSGSNHSGPRMAPIGFTDTLSPVADSLAQRDTVARRKRTRAIEHSDAYYTRLRIHQIASYTELPLFATEYVLGERLLREERTGFPSGGLKGAHQAVALGLGALFTINTVTGGWNLWESRHDPSGRPLRFIHSALMLASDAGFAWAGATGGGDEATLADIRHHRAIAVSSIGVATVGTVMMWLLH
jgi:hypothetical protein